MNETLPTLSEGVDDIPLLLAQVARMGVQPLLDTQRIGKTHIPSDFVVDQ